MLNNTITHKLIRQWDLVKIPILGILVLVFIGQVHASDKLYHNPKIDTYFIESKFIDQTYVIQVKVPMSLKDGTEKFPVLYMPDVNGPMETNEFNLVQGSGEVSRFIIVGIGYQVESDVQAGLIRRRDLTPTQLITDDPKDKLNYRPVLPFDKILKPQKNTGAAPEFLQFIREQLIPFVNKRYNTIPDNNDYAGGSLGGLFGLYVLFNQPDTFKNYIIASPSIWYDDGVTLKYAKQYIQSNKPLRAKVYLSVGGHEEMYFPSIDGGDMVTNVYKLESLLVNADIEGLELKTEIFPQSGHIAAIFLALLKGSIYIFDRGCPLTYPKDQYGSSLFRDCPD